MNDKQPALSEARIEGMNDEDILHRKKLLAVSYLVDGLFVPERCLGGDLLQS